MGTLETATKRIRGPIFNPFETLTPDLIRQKVATAKKHSPVLDSEMGQVTKRQVVLTLTNYYSSPVDLPLDGMTYNSMDEIPIVERGRKMSDENENDLDNIPDEIWVPEKALQALNFERQMEPEITDTALANKIMKDNLPLIAVGITHTAKYSSDARLRFQAQTYVMDRVLGKVGTIVISEDSPIDDLNKQLMALVNSVMDERVEATEASE